MDEGSDAGRWVVHGERSIYDNRWVRLNLVDVTQPDGHRFEHHVVRMQRVSVVAMRDDTGRVLMLRRHRFIDDSWGWELPAGIVEADESPIDAATREALEETGWLPVGLSQVLSFQPAIGIADSPHFLFVAHDAVRQGEPSDLNEAARLAWFDLAELRALVADGEVRDAASLVGVLHLLASTDAL